MTHNKDKEKLPHSRDLCDLPSPMLKQMLSAFTARLQDNRMQVECNEIVVAQIQRILKERKDKA